MLASSRSFDRHVRQVVQLLLTSGSLDVRMVAHTVRTSPRTLQRRLHGLGLTFAGVVQQARQAAAQRMLAEPGRKIGDVAQALGYSDPAHFTRAFRRWTGTTPMEFRRARDANAGPRRA